MSRLVMWLLVLTLFSPCFAAAQMGPEDTVKEAIKQMKESRNLLVATDFTHWETAFEQIAPQYKRRHKLLTPEDYRLHITAFFSDPGSMLSKILTGPTHALTPEMKKEADVKIAAASKEFSKRLRRGIEQIVSADYKVGKAMVNGNSAIVPVKVTSDGRTEDETVPLIKVDNKWLLPKVIYFEHFEDSLPDPMSVQGLLRRGVP